MPECYRHPPHRSISSHAQAQVVLHDETQLTRPPAPHPIHHSAVTPSSHHCQAAVLGELPRRLLPFSLSMLWCPPDSLLRIQDLIGALPDLHADFHCRDIPSTPVSQPFSPSLLSVQFWSRSPCQTDTLWAKKAHGVELASREPPAASLLIHVRAWCTRAHALATHGRAWPCRAPWADPAPCWATSGQVVCRCAPSQLTPLARPR
jgi:hypothetical protein